VTTPRHPYRDQQLRVSLSEFEETRTKQAFKNECDINQIMRKFQKTGALTHLAKYGQEYGSIEPMDLLTAMTTVAEAQRMYDDLPSSVRKKFPDPAAFLEFVQDEENADELYSMGLAVRKSEPEPITVRVQPDEPPPEGGSP
jgi:phage internal scaffolding protein